MENEEGEEDIPRTPPPAASLSCVLPPIQGLDSVDMAEQILSPESSSTDVSACQSPTEVPRVGETSGPDAGTFQGTDVFERYVESVVVEHLRQIAVESPNYRREIIIENLDVENALRRSFSDQLSQIARNVASNLLRQLPETSSNLSLEDWRVFCVPLCWSSKKRVDFWLSFSNMLKDMGSDPPDKWKDFISELERQGPLLFDGNWFNKIGREWINAIDPQFRPNKSSYTSVKGLIHFVRNRWNHLDGFQEKRKLRSAESFCNYLDGLFPSLLRLSYRVAHRFCGSEAWFEEYH